jgi:hypothetical protein
MACIAVVASEHADGSLKKLRPHGRGVERRVPANL